MGHIQAMHVEFLPFALLALDDLIRDPRPREGLRLAMWFTLQSLCSVYLMAMTVIAIVAGTLSRAAEWAHQGSVPALHGGRAAVAGSSRACCVSRSCGRTRRSGHSRA